MKKAPANKSIRKNGSSQSPERYTGDDLKRYIGAFAEDLGGKIGAVAEQVGGLYEKINDVDDRLIQLSDNVDFRFLGVENRLTGVEDRLTGVDGRLTNLETKMDANTEMTGKILIDLEEVKSGLRSKVSREEFDTLEKRMVALEAYVFTHGTKKQVSPKN